MPDINVVRHVFSRGIVAPFVILTIALMMVVLTSGGAGAQEQVLTLEKALKIALSASPAIKERQAQLMWARQAKRASKGKLFPQVNGYASYTRLSDPVAVVPIKGFGGTPPTFSRDLYKTGVNFSLPLYQGGRLWAELSRANFEEKAQENSLRAFKEDLVAQVSDTFYSILYLKALLEARKTTLAALELQRKNAAISLKVGRIPPLDLMEIDTQVTAQHQEIVNTQEALVRMQQRLATLLGYNANKALNVEGDLGLEVRHLIKKTPQLTYLMDSLDSRLMKQLVDARSDIARARRQLEAARQGLKAAKALHLPSLELVGDYGRRAGSGLDGNEEVWSLGVNLNLNIFSGGTISAKVAQAKARLLEAQHRLRSLQLQASSQILSALSSIKEADARLRLSRSVQDTAYEAFKIEKLRYEKGAGTVTDMLRAQASWVQAKASLIKALYDKVSALVALRLYTGSILVANSGDGANVKPLD